MVEEGEGCFVEKKLTNKDYKGSPWILDERIEEYGITTVDLSGDPSIVEGGGAFY